MDVTAALAMDLQRLTADLEGPRQSRAADLTRCLQSLSTDAVTAVSSFLGLAVTVRIDGQDVTLTTTGDMLEPADVRATLRLPLGAISIGLVGTVTFYASRPGAFDDLAAQLRSTLAATGDVRLVVVDEGQSTPALLVSGITGAAELSLVNRAVGVLLERGCTPEEARAELLEQAGIANVSLPVMAQRVLAGASGPRST